MARITYRPTTVVNYGNTGPTGGSGNILGDGNDNTFQSYYEGSGSIAVFPNFNESLIPVNKSVIAVRVAHRMTNELAGGLGLFNGWPASYLRINNTRVNETYNYKQDGYSNGRRTVMGPPLYKSQTGGWDVADLNRMGADVGAAVGTIGPNKKNRWCVATDVWIAVVTDEPVPVPTSPSPANNETISTSSVNFSAQVPAPQEEQSVRAIFQVARDSAFTQEVKTFVGGLNGLETPTSRSYYQSIPGKDSYTGLGPGEWYLRMKGRDYRGVESAWGAATKFKITHGALPTPTLAEPQPGVVSSNPYAMRTATFTNLTTENSGARKVGAEWQFAKDSAFTNSVVSWQNRQGRFDSGSVSYNPYPNPETKPGLYGPTVSLEDPPQRLSQGLTYARVRGVDEWGQVGPWSQTYSFEVRHIPVPADATPKLGNDFDPSTMPITWRFTDPWNQDTQTAYRITIKDSSNTVVYNSGKVLSTYERAQVTLPQSLMFQTLKYTLELWDIDDVKSTAIDEYTFVMSKSPVITCPFPADAEQIVTGEPTITWSVAFSRAGVTQKSFRIVFRNIADSSVAFDTGVISGTATTWTPPRPILKNLSGYQMSLTVTDSKDLSSTLIRNFSTNFIRPYGTQAFADASNYLDGGYVNVIWSGELDPYFAEWRIYRRKVNAESPAEWDRVGTVDSPDQLSYNDWTVAGSGEFEYSVTQVAYRYGSLVESEHETYPVAVYIHSEDYWLIVPDDESRNIRLFSVKGDKYTERRQQNEYDIIGGGTRLSQGPRIGMSGTLSCSIRHSTKLTASEQVAVLRELMFMNGWVLMRDPFGNITKIGIKDISVDRIPGVGNNEYADIEIPYVEVM
ncbi:gp023 [Rhodococcus phage ReqiDocB7]|uniref:minor tail protein n=1 Tax=Rhodococcus phage ReqiDocB7 TaxID=691966 RepID=UPI0001CDD759|nr:minor tail protein [Rhodococcus phage ReqiDocB7]ADD80809.1 gp023 [Rhodococcus phage ReqiDocB7]